MYIRSCLHIDNIMFSDGAIIFFSILYTVAERPQHMLMRVAVGIHMDNIDAAIEVNPLFLLCSFNWHT